MGLNNYVSNPGPLKTPQNFGAIGDGSSHPLSGVYGSLATAQAAYSFTLPGCTTTSSSTSVAVANTAPLRPGYPVSGTGIPANTTVASITDANNFVLSNAATASGTITITSSYVTSLSQELDWAAFQAASYAVGSFYIPAGVYVFGSSTWRRINSVPIGGQGTGVLGDGHTATGAGPQLTKITSTGDAIHVLGRYQSIEELTISGPGRPATNTLTTANGITLGEGNYDNNFHVHHCNIEGYWIGFNNPGDGATASGWDGCSVDNCYLTDNFIGVATYGNQDTLRLTGTTIGAGAFTYDIAGASVTSGNATVTVASTSNIPIGAVVSGTNIPAQTYVNSITDSTHFVMTQNASGTGTITLHVATQSIQVTGSGSVSMEGGVNAGSGMAGVCGESASASFAGVHFELADQTYCYGGVNTGWAFTNCFFQDGGASLIHLEVQSGSNVHVISSSVGTPGLSYIAPGLLYVLTHGSCVVMSPDSTAVQDVNAVMQVIAGDYLIQTANNSLPAASAAYRGKKYYQGRVSPYSTAADEVFLCVQMADGSYAWRPTLNTAIVPAADGTTTPVNSITTTSGFITAKS